MGMGSKLAKLDTGFLESQKHHSHHEWISFFARPYQAPLASRDDSEDSEKIKVSTTWLAASSLLSPAILHHQAAKASHHPTHQHSPHPVFSKQKVPPASLNHPPTPSAGQLLHVLICLCPKMSRQDQVQLPYLNNTKPGYFPRKEHYLLI